MLAKLKDVIALVLLICIYPVFPHKNWPRIPVTSALWRKPLRKLELRILPKWGPWLPFSQARIISDENIWMISPLQFHFQFKFGYELKTVFCSSWIAKESVAIQTGCGKDVNQVKGTSWPEPLKKGIQEFLPWSRL